MRRSEQQGELSLLECWRVVRKRAALVAAFAVAGTVAAAAASLLMTEVYRAGAVIVPVSHGEREGGGLSFLTEQLGGLSGLSLPGSGSASEITSLLNSNILREKVIKRYDLLPVLFSTRWDENKGRWKDPGWTLSDLSPVGLLRGVFYSGGVEDEAPTMWDGIRRLADATTVVPSAKDNTITFNVDFPDPEAAERIATYLLDTLTEHMSGESKRVAEANRRYLEAQLSAVADPIIRQKIYNMMAKQIEISTMSEVKENFAFKVIDPPRVPDQRVWPRRTGFVLIGLAASLALGAGLAFAAEFIERNSKDG